MKGTRNSAIDSIVEHQNLTKEMHAIFDDQSLLSYYSNTEQYGEFIGLIIDQGFKLRQKIVPYQKKLELSDYTT